MKNPINAAVSTGALIADDPAGYLHSLTLDIEFASDDFETGEALAQAVFAKISPDDYGPMLRAALETYAPEAVDSYLAYLAEEEGICSDCAHATHGGVATSEPETVAVTTLDDGRMITAAELILGPTPPGMKLVYLNGNGLDNRRSNLAFWPVDQYELANF
jgi:hypothetical protein